MTEKEKMFKGMLYNPFAEGMSEERQKAHELCQLYNSVPEHDSEKRNEILDELMPNHGEGVYIQGPIQFDFGTHITMGKNSYANFNFCVLDENTVTIGDNVLIGPNCSIYTPLHPLLAEDRNTGYEYSAPVTIGDNCWFGGNVTVLPGVTVGEGCVIGAGSVITKDIPARHLAFGNPCKPVRKLTEKDKIRDFILHH